MTTRTSSVTSSAVVTERLRDASCLSVVSFNSTMHQVHFSVDFTSASDLLLHTNKLYCVLFSFLSWSSMLVVIH